METTEIDKQIFKIEKGIPVKEDAGIKRNYPWDKMEVGDSILIPHADIQRVGTSASQYAFHNNKKFARRKLDEGYRIWRVK